MSTPSTPTLVRVRESTRSPLSSAPQSPHSPELLQMKYKDYKSAVDAIQQLESELNEFQTSSYELEKELEKDLLDLELKNEELKDNIDELERKLTKSRKALSQQEQEFNEYREGLLNQIETLRSQLNEKTAKLIDIEIANDNLEQNERNFKVNQNELKDEYNSVLERNILLESEINDLKNLLLKEQLNNQNIVNELNELKLKPASSQRQTLSHLRTVSTPIPRSSSLMQLHSMRTQSRDMTSKLDSIKNSLHFRKSKATTTTKISSTHVTTQTPGSANSNYSVDAVANDDLSVESRTRKKIIPLSPNSFTLSSLIHSKTRLNKLDVIEGSPNKEPPELDDDDKKSRKKSTRLSFGGFL